MKTVIPEFSTMQQEHEKSILIQQLLGNRIKELRQKKGLGVKKMAFDCGWDKSNLQRLERGNANPTLKTLLIICEQLNISVSELLKELDK